MSTFTSRDVESTDNPDQALAVLDAPWQRCSANPKYPPSRLADAFDQVVEPLITEIT